MVEFAKNRSCKGKFQRELREKGKNMVVSEDMEENWSSLWEVLTEESENILKVKTSHEKRMK